MKGIILAGGFGTRLYPITLGISKQLLPVFDKPMIYYPLSVLMLADIKDILIISTKEDLPSFKRLLGDGSNLGISIDYMMQDTPRGLVDAFILGKNFIGSDSVCLILGDNIFYGHDLPKLLTIGNQNATKGYATIFGYHVKDPSRYGVVEAGNDGNVKSLEEKPSSPRSNLAITGIYFYPNDVINLATMISPSSRGELEITSLNNLYLSKLRLKYEEIGRGFAWLDTGTHESLLEAALFIETIQNRQGLKIGCLEEIAYLKGLISKEKLSEAAKKLQSNDYGEYLMRRFLRE